jgi:hypothetical protein
VPNKKYPDPQQGLPGRPTRTTGVPNKSARGIPCKQAHFLLSAASLCIVMVTTCRRRRRTPLRHLYTSSAQRPRSNTVPSDKPTRFSASFGATNTVLPDKRPSLPAISQDHSRNMACRTIIPEIGHFLAKYSSARLPYHPVRNQRQNLGLEYRTLRQINTVPSSKKLPYSPTNQGVLQAGLRRRRVGRQRITCKSGIFAEIGPPRHNTVLSNKLYRTPPQAIPYPPARDTVLPNK